MGAVGTIVGTSTGTAMDRAFSDRSSRRGGDGGGGGGGGGGGEGGGGVHALRSRPTRTAGKTGACYCKCSNDRGNGRCFGVVSALRSLRSNVYALA